MALTLADLAEADLIIAVKEAEHRALMAEQFPLWKDRIEYWHVDDLDCAEAHEALPHLENQIHALVERLRVRTGTPAQTATRPPGRRGEPRLHAEGVKIEIPSC